MRPPALTVYRPFPKLILGAPGKDVENRTWKTNYRGDLLIHGAHTWEPGALAYAGSLADLAARSTLLPRFTLDTVADDTNQHPRGIVGVAELYDVCSRSHTDPATNCGCSPWAIPGHHHWKLRNPAAFAQPVPHSGKQNMWTVKDESWPAVFAQLKAVGRTPGAAR